MKGRDREFRLTKVSYVDFKHIEIERTLLNLFPRLKFDGYPGRVRLAGQALTVEKFADEFTDEKNKHNFRGFADHKEIVYKWLETDLLDLVNRGRPTQAVVSPRPLHGNTYKFRNTRHARDYGTSEQVYWMLYHARNGLGQAARDTLKEFIFTGLDLLTDKIQASAKIDIETQAILHFESAVEVKRDTPDTTKDPERYPPLCIAHADLLADDVLRLMAYQDYMPRSVLVDYLKTLLSFHLALYHLRLLKLLPELVRRKRGDPPCALSTCPIASNPIFPYVDCPYQLRLVVDMGDTSNVHMAELARRSADTYYRRIPGYIQAQFIIKKLDEMAEYLHKANKLQRPTTGYFAVGDLLRLLEPAFASEREAYFKARLAGFLEEADNGEEHALDPEVRRVTEMGLGDFETYIEILVALRGSFHRRYLVDCLDSLLLKNTESGLLRQSRTKGSPRRFALGSRLLEVLLQIAVLMPQGSSFVTREIRIDELLLFLRERYGLYIDCLPLNEGFGKPSITDLQALRKNRESFKMRLREIGFFQDLSDAYVTQTATPRYTITTHHH
ncbi:MAG TPA: hypothetical protein VKT82_00210 [Ktedonobacterales bacterium]|nr:hypothetical protein [Ktedonobacterales bacterium]